MQWQDDRGLRTATVLYLVWWVGLLATNVYCQVSPSHLPSSTRHAVERVAFWMVFALPFVAAFLAGWWRATAVQSGWWLGGSLLSGLLAGPTSLCAFLLAEFVLYDHFRPPITQSSWLPQLDFSGLYPIALIVGVAFSLLAGVVGGLVGGLAARVWEG